MEIAVRLGQEADANAAIKVLRRSIIELCVSDHGDDEQTLALWLANKTEKSWTAWLNRIDATLLVAENAGEIIGIGMVDHRGEVLLNYVQPGFRFCGVSTSLLAALESDVQTRNVQRCFLESTETAKSFYKSCGYKPTVQGGLKLEKRL